MQFQAVAGHSDPFGGVDRAVRINQGNKAVVFGTVTALAVIHSQYQIALGIKGTAL